MSDTAVTVAELDELLDDGPTQCDVTTRLVVEIMHRRLYDRSRHCEHAPQRLIVITCSADGPRREAICKQHLRLLKTGKVVLSCSRCQQPAVWKDTY